MGYPGGAGRTAAALLGGAKTGPSPVDRARKGSKHHLIACGQGNPLAIALTAGNVNDITQTMTLIDAIPPVKGKRGRPRRRPKRLLGDRAYHSKRNRRDDIHEAFTSIACSLICFKALTRADALC